MSFRQANFLRELIVFFFFSFSSTFKDKASCGPGWTQAGYGVEASPELLALLLFLPKYLESQG